MFYDNFVNLCAGIGKSPSAVAVEIGFQKSAVSRWKKSGATPTDANLQRIAKYFGVSVEHLLGNEQKEKPSGRTSEELDEELKFALFGGGDVTDAQFEEVKKFARFLKERDKKD